MMSGTVGGTGVGNRDDRDCIRIIHAALDRVISFVDTAMQGALNCGS